MALIQGVEKTLLNHTPIRVSKMEELFEMEGSAPRGAGGPPEMAGGGIMEVPNMPEGMGPPPAPKDLTAAIWVDNGEISSKSRTSAVYGGEITAQKGDHVRIQTYDSKVGGVYVTGGNSDFTLENTTISINGDGSGMGLGGAVSGACVASHGTLTLRNVNIISSGNGRSATAAEEHSVLKVYNSLLCSQGAPYGDDVPEDRREQMGPPAALEILGNTRTHVTVTNSFSYFYDSTVICDGWAALSTDASEGFVYLEANRTNVIATKSGYGAYADTFCHDYFNDCDFNVGSMAGILAGESDMTFRNCTCRCGTYFAFLHCVGGPPTQKATCQVEGGHILTGSDVFTIRSHNADIILKGVDIHPGNGVLVHSMVNLDRNATQTGGRQVYGIRVTLADMSTQGDLIHEDPARDMIVTLTGTQLKGTIQNAHLRLDTGSRWIATGNSAITLLGKAETAQFDAPAGVTITLWGQDAGTYPLASGGTLVCHSL